MSAAKDREELESLARELERTRAELHEARATIAAMKASRFWKLRDAWWAAKGALASRARLRDLRPRRAAAAGAAWPLPAPVATGAPKRTTARVDVVVCVHDALEDVTACLSSVLRHTRPPYRLVLVDDGSSAPTRDYLARFAAEQGATLLRNETALGYTRAANGGMRQATGDYVVLLNSDTLVTPDWLDRLVACAESSPEVGLVGPLSNCASWQSVPEVFDANGDWNENPLPEDLEPDALALALAASSGLVHPRLPFLNGFCLLVSRRVLERVGVFDEETFGKGYGEENDYAIRAADAGFALAVADDAYVFHRQSRSYSHERRRPLVEAAGRALVEKHGAARLSAGAEACRESRVLAGIRARASLLAPESRLLAEGRRRFEGRRVLFVLPVTERGGGANVVLSEARAMGRMGVDARITNLVEFRAPFERSYGDAEPPVLYAAREEIAALGAPFDAVVATAYSSVAWIEPLASAARRPVLGYYVQDFEPYFFPEGSPEHEEALRSYTRIPGLVRMTKTEWNRAEVERRTGADCAVVGPSFDVHAFRPRTEEPASPPVRIAAMVRPSTPRRQPERTVALLREVVRRHGARVEVVLFGVAPDDPAFTALGVDFPHRMVGVLDAARLVSLFNAVHVFADYSAFQAMGLVALEAMASGAAVLVPERGGSTSFARHEENALVVDTESFDAALAATERLVGDAALRRRLAARALADVVEKTPTRAAFRLLDALFPEPAE